MTYFKVKWFAINHETRTVIIPISKTIKLDMESLLAQMFQGQTWEKNENSQTQEF